MRRERRSGISLLETMIALAVMALIAVTLAAGMGSSARVLRSSGSVTVAVDQAVARRDLRFWVEQALAGAFPGQSEGELRGLANHLQFSFVAVDGQFWAGDPVVVTVALNENSEVTLSAQGSSDETQRKVNRIQVLAGPNAALSIAYFGRLRPEDPMSWLDQWPPGAGLPGLIRFTFSTPQVNIPPLTIRPGKAIAHSELSLSSLLPPSLPSRP